MPADEVTVIQLCGRCKFEVGTFTVKKDNLMLTSKEEVWCPQCQANTPELRDVAGRRSAIQSEIDSYPKSTPAELPRTPQDKSNDR